LWVARSDKPGLSFPCDDPSLPTDSGNLVVRAADFVLRRSRVEPASALGLSITLKKRIPSAAGLGGGSSDAATTLAGVNRLLDRRLPGARLAEEAQTLGSDVPFFFAAPSAWCTGRGEKTFPLAPPGVARWSMIVLPPFGLSTAEVYRRFDDLDLGRTEDLSRPVDLNSWPALPARQLLAKLENDLERPAFDLHPELGQMRAAIERLIDRPVRMSGSGSTLFSLFDTEPEATDACVSAQQRFAVQAVAVKLAPESAIESIL
jgi:4-diphosphocytidyl-2-C-methyl-D-erythritol kinase